MDEEEINAFLEPLKTAIFAKEYHYQALNLSALNTLMTSLHALYTQAESQIRFLEQEIALYKLETEK